MADARFFKNISDKNIQRSVMIPIEVRGDVFRALAFAIMDNLKSGGRLPEAAFKKIVDRLALHFPDSKRNQADLLLEPEASGCLAFVLRQLAVDEAIANPSAYQELFSELSRDLPQDYLRQIDTPLHPCALTALAQALNITITCSIKDIEKELRVRQVLNKKHCSSNFNVTLQVQDDVYFPCVKNHAYFSAIAHLPINIPKPVMPNTTRTLVEPLDEIAQSNEPKWQKYEQYRRMLRSTIEANQLTAQALAFLYASFLPDTSTAHLFTNLEKKHHKVIINGSRGNLEQQKIEMFVNAFAGALSVGDINEDELFDAIEPSAYHRTSRVS